MGDLQAVKDALRILTDVYDNELNALIQAAADDLEASGADSFDSRRLTAVKLYCAAYFGANADGAMVKAYEDYKKSLRIEAGNIGV